MPVSPEFLGLEDFREHSSRKRAEEFLEPLLLGRCQDRLGH